MDSYRHVKTLLIRPEDILAHLKKSGHLPANTVLLSTFLAFPTTGLMLCLATSSEDWPAVDEHEWPPRIAMMYNEA